MIDLRVPGDKSISHRSLMLACLATGESRIRGVLDAEDVRATAGALRGLGAAIPGAIADEVVIEGPAPWRDARQILDCGNSGTAARLLCGLVVGLGRGARLDGDSSLRSRPMDRVVYPLQAMGGRIEYHAKRDRLPLSIGARASGGLRTLRHRGRVASAQVKSSLLLAGLASGTVIEVWEPVRSRDHTERMLESMGVPLLYPGVDSGYAVRFDPSGWNGLLRPLDVTVPGDLSSAAFLVAAALLGRRPVRLFGVGLNDSRTGFLTILREMGVEWSVEEERWEAGEPVGDLLVHPSQLKPFHIRPDHVPSLVDEIPVLAILAARAPGLSTLEGIGELRVKESDRLNLLATNLSALGVRCEERADGMSIHGSEEARLRGHVRTGGDHRLAMAFGVLARLPESEIDVDDTACVAVSYPGFWSDLSRLLPA